VRHWGRITLGAVALVAIAVLTLPKSTGPYVFVVVMLLVALAYFRSNPAETPDRRTDGDLK
jgi:hypothetical protein